MSDLRSPLAKARDEWLESEEGRRCLEGMPSGHWLENRIRRAFLAGANAQRELRPAPRRQTEFDTDREAGSSGPPRCPLPI